MQLKGKRDHDGFSLVELLIALAIIGLLAAIAIPQFTSYLDKAAYTSCQSELASLRKLISAENTVSNAVNSYSELSDSFYFEACSNFDGDGDIASSASFTATDSRGQSVTLGADFPD